MKKHESTPEQQPMEELMTPGEVADALRVSLSTIRDWVREDRLEAVLLPSGHRRYRRSQIEKILSTTEGKR